MRYTPHTQSEIEAMLRTIGVERLDDLYAAVPSSLLNPSLALPDGMTEREGMRRLRELSSKNKHYLSFLGAGCYPHYVPEAVQAILSRGEFATAYTPYQAEASQGTLQVIFEYQSLLCELLLMDVANASMYDGASSLAESVLMAKRLTRQRDRKKLLIASSLHPFYKETLRAYLMGQEIEVVTLPYDRETGRVAESALRAALTEDIFAVCVQSPNFFGVMEDTRNLRNLIPKNVLYLLSAHPVAAALFTPPGECGADIVSGDAQSIGIVPGYGGPHLGFLLTRQKYIRQLPGRIVSETKDREGRRGYVLTLQTREQHIRREKATSNICSNHQLNALATVATLALTGAEGLRKRAAGCVQNLRAFERALEERGVQPLFSGIKFCETVIPLSDKSILQKFYESGIFPGVFLPDLDPALPTSLLVYVSDEHTEADLKKWFAVWDEFSER